MIRVSGWITDVKPHSGIEEKSKYLLPISSGYQRFFAADGMDYAIERPQGRLDTQILYVQSGHGDFRIRDNAFSVSTGQVIVIPAHVPHWYTYRHATECTVYWVHCSGYGLGGLLSRLLSENSYCLKVGQSKRLVELYRGIMQELQRKEPFFEDIAIGLLQELIFYILRKQVTERETSQRLRDERIDKSVMLMHEQYMKNWTVNELAQQVNLSPSRFIHLFTQIHQLPPAKFLNNIRINEARELLGDYGLSISDVSSMVGFRSLHYFSRAFRASSGMSPSDYRRKIEEQARL